MLYIYHIIYENIIIIFHNYYCSPKHTCTHKLFKNSHKAFLNNNHEGLPFTIIGFVSKGFYILVSSHYYSSFIYQFHSSIFNPL